MLGVGVIMMVLGCAIMVYMQITSETSEDETSDAIKKIIVNFLQLISLASGLPLQWPKPVETMFITYSTMSSAGTTLMIPGQLGYVLMGDFLFTDSFFLFNALLLSRL